MTPEPPVAPADHPLQRTRVVSTSLRDAWRTHAADFIAWARKPNHDSYWRHHRAQFFSLMPAPGRRTLDLGCGEGRVSRDLVSLGHDVVGLDAAPVMLRAARVLEPGGRLCLAIVHPLNSAGRFAGDGPESPFTIEGSYLDPSFYADSLVRDGLTMTFVSAHRPISTYTETLSDAGFLIEHLRETRVPPASITLAHQGRWQRLPLFLHLRAIKRA